MGLQEENYVSKPFRQVLEGRFPAKDVKKMNRKTLEQFVLKLIQHTIADGAKTKTSFISVCNGFNSKQISKPAWWPSDNVLGPDFPSNSRILLTNRLRLLVEKCAEFFKNSCDNFVHELYIDENSTSLGTSVRTSFNHEVQAVRRSLRVRSLSKDDEHNKKPKKRKAFHLKNFTPAFRDSDPSYKVQTLISSSPSIDISNAIFDNEVEVCFKKQAIPLNDGNKTKTVEDTEDQTSFLGNLFGLSKNECKDGSKDEKLIIPSYNHHVVKLVNSHNIPFSSDIGRMLIGRDVHCFPESLQVRKCERLEWYINKAPQRLMDIKYEVTYTETKKDPYNNKNCHIYKFPKRQLCQYQYPTKFQLEVCKNMKVVLRRDNLQELKRAWKTPQMLQIVLPKMARAKMEQFKIFQQAYVINPVNSNMKKTEVQQTIKKAKLKSLVSNPFHKSTILKSKQAVKATKIKTEISVKTSKVKNPIKKLFPIKIKIIGKKLDKSIKKNKATSTETKKSKVKKVPGNLIVRTKVKSVAKKVPEKIKTQTTKKTKSNISKKVVVKKMQAKGATQNKSKINEGKRKVLNNLKTSTIKNQKLVRRKTDQTKANSKGKSSQSMTKSKTVNSKVQKVLQKQQKLKQTKDQHKSRPKVAKSKIQCVPKKKLVQKLNMKKLKVQFPNQGNTQKNDVSTKFKHK